MICRLTQTDTHTRVHTHTNIHTNTQTHTNTHAHTYTNTHMRAHTQTQTCTLTRARAPTHTHTYTHTNTHKHARVKEEVSEHGSLLCSSPGSCGTLHLVFWLVLYPIASEWCSLLSFMLLCETSSSFLARPVACRI